MLDSGISAEDMVELVAAGEARPLMGELIGPTWWGDTWWIIDAADGSYRVAEPEQRTELTAWALVLAPTEGVVVDLQGLDGTAWATRDQPPPGRPAR